jgi:hypothetical protein
MLKRIFGGEWRAWRARLGIVQSLYSSKPAAELERNLLVDPKLLGSAWLESLVVGGHEKRSSRLLLLKMRALRLWWWFELCLKIVL